MVKAATGAMIVYIKSARQRYRIGAIVVIGPVNTFGLMLRDMSHSLLVGMRQLGDHGRPKF